MAKIMVVDDSPADLKFMQSVLAGGHQVSAVEGGEQLEARVAAENPDLILLDVVMPGRNGYELLRALRRDERTKDVKVIFVSSKGGDTDVKWGLRQGAVDYVVKPYTPETVLNTISKHL